MLMKMKQEQQTIELPDCTLSRIVQGQVLSRPLSKECVPEVVEAAEALRVVEAVAAYAQLKLAHTCDLLKAEKEKSRHERKKGKRRTAQGHRRVRA